MKKQFAVLGLGRFGYTLATTLAKIGHEVVAIDAKEAPVNKISEQVTRAIQADVRDEQTLKALGVRNFDTVVVAIGQDIQANILTSVMLKELGVAEVVAKAQNEMHGKVLEKIGVDKVVYPEKDMGERVAHCLSSSNIMDQIQLSPDYRIAEVKATPKVQGQDLGKLNLRAKLGINVLAVKRENDIIVSPGANNILEEGNIIVVLGSNKALEKLENYI